MNWPELLRVIMRLTDHYYFYFKASDGMPEVMLSASESWYLWKHEYSNKHITIIEDEQLNVELHKYRQLELVGSR